MALTLDSEVKFLKGVGPRGATALAKAEIHTVRDLLQYMPRRWEDRSNLPPIARARAGEAVSIRGFVKSFDVRPISGGRVILKALVKDESGSILLTWFNAPWLRPKLEHYRGEIIAYGMVKDNGLALEITSPDLEFVDEDDDAEDFARITAVYPLVQGLAQPTVRRAVESALTYGLPLVEDPLPESMRKIERLPPLQWALRQVHRPDDEMRRLQGRGRAVFDEFLAMQLAVLKSKAAARAEPGITFPITPMRHGQFPPPVFGLDAGESEGTLDELIARMLPFTPTEAQSRVIAEIYRDMEDPRPMARLVQGDVGSGKTAVAAAAMLAAVKAGWQTALMAPTEILAEQHHLNLSRMLAPLGIPVELLVGKLTPSQKKRAADRVASGEAPVAVGTHALVQGGVTFARLGLAVVDEQHRFGVMHRAALAQKGLSPDVLFMTATPIPRTLAMTVHGDLDVSVIDELPPGRKPIKTRWMTLSERERAYAGVLKELARGRQAYVVCPMVSESEKMLAQAAEELHRVLSEGVLSDYRVGLLHGGMRPREKEAAMDAFRAGEVHVLVSTTVIEVGVDVPNATVMIVEDANRFGLAQLHQLRGRVGRGGDQSFCVLLADATNPDARTRLETMVETTDGFEIAEKDLELRGPGEIAGTKQSGDLDFRIADVVQDRAVLEKARAVAVEVILKDPELVRPEHEGLARMARRPRGLITEAILRS